MLIWDIAWPWRSVQTLTCPFRDNVCDVLCVLYPNPKFLLNSTSRNAVLSSVCEVLGVIISGSGMQKIVFSTGTFESTVGSCSDSRRQGPLAFLFIPQEHVPFCGLLRHDCLQLAGKQPLMWLAEVFWEFSRHRTRFWLLSILSVLSSDSTGNRITTGLPIPRRRIRPSPLTSHHIPRAACCAFHCHHWLKSGGRSLRNSTEDEALSFPCLEPPQVFSPPSFGLSWATAPTGWQGPCLPS